MNKLATKHKFICSFIFSIIIIQWLSIGNVSAITISKWNIYLNTTFVLTGLFIAVVCCPMFLNSTIPNKRLNIYELFLNSALPVLLHYIFKTLDHSFIPSIIFLIFCIALTVGIIYLQKSAHVKRVRVIYYLRHIIALGIIIVILPCYIYYRYEKPVYEFFEEPPKTAIDSTERDVVQDDIVKIVYDCNWESSNNEKRAHVLFEVVKFEASQLGISPPKVYITNEMKEITYGSYDNETNIIRMSNYHLGQRTKKECITTALHELYHAYEFSVINITKTLSDEQKSNVYFEKANKWVLANENYSEDHKNPATYENNMLEVDARAYAEKTTEKYFKYDDKKLYEAIEKNFDDLFGEIEDDE